jgi:hypothetical protein
MLVYQRVVNWDDYSQYMEKCSKPPTSYDSVFLVSGILVDVDTWNFAPKRTQGMDMNG